ncbi:6603_t:CDS:1, partial [Rhizophagus irregularis]
IILLSNTLINRNRKEVARLEAIKAINDVEDIKIFDDDFFSDEPIDSNHPINARTERVPEGPRISVQVKPVQKPDSDF